MNATLIRLCKTSLVASLALFFAIVAFGNLADYETNRVFVQHVLAMDTIFPGSSLTWRAVTDPHLVTAAYWSIIGWELVTALLLTAGSIRLVAACLDGESFRQAKPLVILGLTCGLLLYGLGITVVGGEWFAMWQSKDWNGLDSAARFIVFDGIVLLALLLDEA